MTTSSRYSRKTSSGPFPWGKEAFEEYQVCQQELMLLTDKATFARGFQLGARLMLEIIEE